jgi:hypothetical protein
MEFNEIKKRALEIKAKYEEIRNKKKRKTLDE